MMTNGHQIGSEYINIHKYNSPSMAYQMPWYCPISVKDEKNMPQPSNFPTDNISIFLSTKNIYTMIYYVISLNTSNKTDLVRPQIGDLERRRKDRLQIMKDQIPIKMHEWTKTNSINDYEDLYDNIFMRLNYLNKQFLLDNGNLFDLIGNESINVFQIKSDKVTDKCGNISDKKYDEMLASDYHTLDLHKPLDIFRTNSNFRYANAVPVWQKSMNTRHYERGNDGLHTALSDRASLNTQSRGYDMSEIYKGCKSYENHYYDNI
jgi:hypothetical protein